MPIKQTYTWQFPETEENLDGYNELPDWLKTDIIDYINNGTAWIDDALMSMLENNFVNAVCACDNNTIKHIKVIAILLYNKVPSDCWGNKEIVNKWIKHNGYSGKGKNNA